MPQATNIVKNKFWIVEDQGQKIATVQATKDGVVLVQNNHRLKYPSIKILSTMHNIQFLSKHKKSTKIVNLVHDYPSREYPHNIIYDLHLKLPMYTISAKSKSYYCAGYYIIKYNTEWLTEFCPKRIILQRNSYFGPFKNKSELLDKLKLLNAD